LDLEILTQFNMHL